MKRLFVLILLFWGVLGIKTSFAQICLIEDFENTYNGAQIDTRCWNIQEKAETGGNIQVVNIDGNNVIRNTLTYRTGYEKSDSFIQSKYLNFNERCVISARVMVPEDAQGSLSIVLRGSGDATANTMYLCTITSNRISYFPNFSQVRYEQLSPNQWLTITIVINKTGAMSIFRDNIIKNSVSDYKSESNGRFEFFNIDQFALRMYTSVSRKDGYSTTSYYDDIMFYDNISLEDGLYISYPELIFNKGDFIDRVNYVRKGDMNAKIVIHNFEGVRETVTLLSAVYNKNKLKDIYVKDVELGKALFRTAVINLPTENLNSGDVIKFFCIQNKDTIRPLITTLSFMQNEYIRPYEWEIRELYESSQVAGLHPRILATAEDFDQLRHLYNNNATIKNWCTRILQNADKIISEDTCKYIIKDNKRLLEQSRLVLNRVLTLGMAYQITGLSKYSDRAWLELESAGNFPDWNPMHFLDTAEMTAAFAIGYDWMYDAFDGMYVKKDGEMITQREFLEQAILNFGLSNGIKAYRGTLENNWGWFTNATHNWNSVCNGGLTLGALAVADIFPDVAFEIISGAIASLEVMMPSFAPDGAWFEGPGYWHYAVKYLTLMLASLDKALDTDFGITSFPGVSDTVEFICQVTGPKGTNNFHDGGSGYINSPEMFWFSQKFNAPEMAAVRFMWMEQYKLSPSPLDLVYYNGEDVERHIPYPLDKYYRGVELVSMRSSWIDPLASFLSFHAGKSVVNHSHIDNGAFVYDSQGVRWALDLGSDHLTYTTHYGDLRYEVYRIRAESHNTLVINPDSSPGHDLDANTVVERFENNAEEAFAVLDLSDAFKQHATSVKRGYYMMDGRSSVLIRDEVELKGPSDIYWFMQTRAKVTINGNQAILTQDGKQLILHFVSDADSTILYTTSSEPLPTSPNPPGQASNAGVTRIIIKMTGTDTVNLSVKLSHDSALAQEIPDTKLRDWSLSD